MFDSLRHLLPDATAWRLIVDRLLKQYLAGIATVGTDVVSFVDDVSDDFYPATTRELKEWEKKFGLTGVGTDATRRLALAAAWAATGGQSPGYIQSVLRAAGFTDAYVYDSFDKTDASLTTYDGVRYQPLGLQDASPYGFCFGLGGRKMYVVGAITDTVYQYSLPELLDDVVPHTPYDLDEFVYDGASVAVLAGSRDVKLSPDGMKMFILESITDTIAEYDLAEAFLISTATFSVGFSVGAQETVPQGFAWHPDGTRVFITGTGSDNVHQYELGTAWDISTASFTKTYVVPVPLGYTDIAFTEDGASFLCMAFTINDAIQYDCTTPWDIGTVTVPGHVISFTPQDTDPLHITIEHGKLFMIGTQNWDVYRYTLFGPRDATAYTNIPLKGLTQCGETGADPDIPIPQCGEEPPDQTTRLSAVCDRFLANEVWYLWNDMLTNEAPPVVPDDSLAWPHFWYIGGTPFGTPLDVILDDRKRLETLLLKLGPTEQWIVTMFRMWRMTLISEWGYRVPSGIPAGLGEWGFVTGFTSPISIGDTDASGDDQQAAIATFLSGDRIRAERTDDQSWTEYVLTSNSNEFAGYWTIPINATPVAQSPDWAGFPGAGEPMKIYHLESV